jgi:hypothetical protein
LARSVYPQQWRDAAFGTMQWGDDAALVYADFRSGAATGKAGGVARRPC